MQILEIKTDTVNLTEEQFFNLCARNKELRIERDKHKNIIIMSPTGAKTGNYNIKIGSKVEIWNEKNDLGFTFDSNTGFTLPTGAMRSPDVAWIPKDKWNNISEEEQERFPNVCPDFIIEIVSKSDSVKQQQEKMEEWLENGCRLAWLINPATRTTIIFRANLKHSAMTFNQTRRGEDVLPGFE